MFEWAPLRSRSARMFIGPELSTHTISFKVSPQHECDALWEKNSNHSLVIYMKTLFMFHKRFYTHQTTVPSPEPKSRRDWGAKEGSLFFIWNDLKKKKKTFRTKKKKLDQPPYPGLLSDKDIYFVISLTLLQLYTRINTCFLRYQRLWSPPLVLYLIHSSPHCCIASSQPSHHVHHT